FFSVPAVVINEKDPGDKRTRASHTGNCSISTSFSWWWGNTLRAAHDPTQSKRSRIMKFYLS
ncbi:MAG: hypothetical protein PV344_01440, partial [Anaplasma sp.]|nr:hypothetical protein [Anaplasma sp.]